MSEAQPVPLPWGVTSETDPLTDVLLCRPTHFSWHGPANAITRSVAETERQRFDPLQAAAQFEALERALIAAGVRCHFVEPDPALQSQCFTRDPGVMSPWGLVLTLMESEVRRGEYAGVLDFCLARGVPVWRKVTAGGVEGGDVQVLREGRLLIGYTNARTSRAGADQLAGFFETQGWETKRLYVDAHFLHLDVLFTLADPSTAVACTDVLSRGLVEELAAFAGVERVIGARYKEVMALGANTLALGGGRVIATASPETERLVDEMRGAGLEVIGLDLSQFVADGGGPHCLTLPLARKA